jgi:hypothetical protein
VTRRLNIRWENGLLYFQKPHSGCGYPNLVWLSLWIRIHTRGLEKAYGPGPALLVELESTLLALVLHASQGLAGLSMNENAEHMETGG